MISGKAWSGLFAVLVLVTGCTLTKNKRHKYSNNLLASADAKAKETASPVDSKGAPKTCKLALECKAHEPELGDKQSFHNSYSSLLSKTGSPAHRGRDSFIKEGEKATVVAKFAYGAIDADLKGEDVDIYLSRGCSSPWEKLTTVKTSTDGKNPTVDGLADTGGQIAYEIPELLKPGRYRIFLAVAGDHSSAELNIEVLPKTAKLVVTDIDGTLTSSEMAAASSVIGLPDPEAHPGAADMIRAFYQRGYYIFYLTARPASMMQITRNWINARGFPPGIIHTSPFKAGAVGEAAANFKIDELKLLKAKIAVTPSYAFGNKPSDVTAFKSVGIEPGNSYFYKVPGDLGGAHDHSNYSELVAMALAAPYACD